MPKTKYMIVCNGIPMRMARSENDIFYKTDNYLLFESDATATKFESLLSATQAVEITLIYAIKHGYEDSWGIFDGYSIVPWREPELA